MNRVTIGNASTPGDADDGETEPDPDTGGDDGDGIPNPTITETSGDDDNNNGDGADADTGPDVCLAPAPPGCPCGGDDDCGVGTACLDGICNPPTCGDRAVDRGEACDDGNLIDDDGCDADCQLSRGVAGVAAGAEHTCAWTHDGGAKCWGRGGMGRLGYADDADVGIVDTPSDHGFIEVGGPVRQMCAGGAFTCALLDDGDVRCWGSAGSGQLGLANTEVIGDNEHPDEVAPIQLGDAATSIACGVAHACAVLASDGAVRCWGDHRNGRLGSLVDNEIGDDEHPDSIAPVQLGAAAVQLTAGESHTCAVLDDGTVRCWGRAESGRLGNGTTSPDIGDNESPDGADNVVTLQAPALQVAAGQAHTCARLTGGALQCWGDNAAGQLGSGDTQDIGDAAPLDDGDVVASGGTVVAVAAAPLHTCALLQNGELRCWGDGADGRLGLANSDDLLTPGVDAIEVALDTNVIDVAAAGSHTCARVQGGDLYCFGRNNRGQLGYGPLQDGASVGDTETPASAGPVPFD